MLSEILSKFGLSQNDQIVPFGNGLINNTWLIDKKESDERLILQRVNQNVL